MGSRLILDFTYQEKRRKRLGVFFLLVFMFLMLFVPIKSDALVLDAIVDAVTDSADMAQDSLQHAKEMAVLNAIKSVLKTVLTNVKALLKLFKQGAIVSILVDAFSALVMDTAATVMANAVELLDSMSVLFSHDIGKFFMTFSSKIGHMLWIVGAGYAVLELGITYRSNSISIGEHTKNIALNIFKSLLAVNLFVLLPVKFYLFCSKLSIDIVSSLFKTTNRTRDISLFLNFSDTVMKIILAAVTIYAAFKVLFSVIKRSGVLLILISIGSLHMVSIPRGFWEGFWSWVKQVIALSVTNFCQIIIYSAGVALAFGSQSLAIDFAGLACMLAACEVPKYADRFGMDTSIHSSASSAMYNISTLLHLVK